MLEYIGKFMEFIKKHVDCCEKCHGTLTQGIHSVEVAGGGGYSKKRAIICKSCYDWLVETIWD